MPRKSNNRSLSCRNLDQCVVYQAVEARRSSRNARDGGMVVPSRQGGAREPVSGRCSPSGLPVPIPLFCGRLGERLNDSALRRATTGLDGRPGCATSSSMVCATSVRRTARARIILSRCSMTSDPDAPARSTLAWNRGWIDAGGTAPPLPSAEVEHACTPVERAQEDLRAAGAADSAREAVGHQSEPIREAVHRSAEYRAQEQCDGASECRTGDDVGWVVETEADAAECHQCG